jgi:translation initiation factor IF-1
MGQEDRALPDKKTFKNVILTEGDVVVVSPSCW